MSLADTAAALLARYGEPVVLSYASGGDTDPVTGEQTTPPTVVTVNGNGYTGRYKSSDVDGYAVLATDIRLVLEKVSAVPQVGWDVTVAGVGYQIVHVQRLRQTGADVLYLCQLRAQ